jgi:hypothetical protein
VTSGYSLVPNSVENKLDCVRTVTTSGATEAVNCPRTDGASAEAVTTTLLYGPSRGPGMVIATATPGPPPASASMDVWLIQTAKPIQVNWQSSDLQLLADSGAGGVTTGGGSGERRRQKQEKSTKPAGVSPKKKKSSGLLGNVVTVEHAKPSTPTARPKGKLHEDIPELPSKLLSVYELPANETPQLTRTELEAEPVVGVPVGSPKPTAESPKLAAASSPKPTAGSPELAAASLPKPTAGSPNLAAASLKTFAASPQRPATSPKLSMSSLKSPVGSLSPSVGSSRPKAKSELELDLNARVKSEPATAPVVPAKKMPRRLASQEVIRPPTSPRDASDALNEDLISPLTPVTTSETTPTKDANNPGNLKDRSWLAF